jgi:single-stranded DNA-binding protein
MKDLNEVCISGTLMRDPVLRRTRADHDMCTVMVSVMRPEPSKAHDYLDVICWEELAAKVADEFRAGERILFKGRLRKNNYTSTDGQKRVSTQIIADYVQRPEEPAYYESAEAAGAYAENMA